MRTVGVEEELLIVRTGTGQAVSVAPQVLRQADRLAVREQDESSEHAEAGSSLDGELQRQQVETDTAPHRSMADLHEELVSWRTRADDAARREGARIAAVGTSPIPVEPRTANSERFGLLLERFGLMAAEQLTCGAHVHVQVDSDDEAIGALDRMRVWLPTLLALTGNSPFWQGTDTAYASYRSQVMSRWPSAGPPDIYGSAANYRATVRHMVQTGVLLDPGMVYYDARPSHTYPTLEIRVADVCQDVRDTVVLAALCRALVETAAQEWRDGSPTPAVPVHLLRLATWQAGRYGLGGDLLDPSSSLPRPAGEVLDSLYSYVRPALVAAEDDQLVDDGLQRILTTGTGADRQRRILAKTGDVSDVVAAAVRATRGQEGEDS